jgi:hypothetical protein
MPAARRAGAHILAPITFIRTPGERVSAAAVAEFFLKTLAQIAGPLVRGGVRIAVVENVQGAGHFPLLVTIELLEERHQRGGIFDRNVDSV